MLYVYVLIAGTHVTWDKELSEEVIRGGFVDSVQRSASQAYATVANQMGVRMERDIAVTVHTPTAYAKLFGQERGDRNGAHYFRGEIHVNAGFPIDAYFTGLLCHEMTHAVIDRGGKGHRVPTWLNEGLAELFSHRCRGITSIDDVQHTFLVDAARDRSLVSLTAIDSPLSATEYLAAYAGVVFLASAHGSKIFHFVEAIISGTSTDAAARDLLGRSMSDVDTAFMTWIKSFER